MYKKDQIVDLVKSLELTDKQYCLIAGASLVMYNIKDATEDIDLVVSKKEFDRISKIYELKESPKKEYDRLYDLKDKQIEVRIVDNINYYIKENTIIKGIYCNSILNDFDWKLKHNRDKDQETIKKERKLLEEVSNRYHCDINNLKNQMIIDYIERKKA